MKKIGIITFHNSYNCGSMLESYAIQETVKRNTNKEVEIINFSNEGQKEVYSTWFKNNSIKNIVKNILIIPGYKKINNNNLKYEEFKDKYFNLSKEYDKSENLSDEDYLSVISGSDQIWNITIKDGDDAYFLNWVKSAKKIAYAPSFGARRIEDNTKNIEKYKKYLNNYDAISIRENNGQKWIKDLTGKDVPVLLDPTLLLKKSDYDKLIANDININEKYIFFYSPGFDNDICELVYKISKKYNLKVYTWSTKQYYIKNIAKYKFKLVDYENPSSYLYCIKNAELVLTTSYHGTIFSTIYNKKFFTIKNGGMFGTDDRVITLLKQLDMMKNLISIKFDNDFDYLKNTDYTNYKEKLKPQIEKSLNYINNSLGDINERNK